MTPKRRKNFKTQGNVTPIVANATTATPSIPAVTQVVLAASSNTTASHFNPLPPIGEVEEGMEVCDETARPREECGAGQDSVDDRTDHDAGVASEEADGADIGDTQESSRENDDRFDFARLEERLEAESNKRKAYEMRATDVMADLASKIDSMLKLHATNTPSKSKLPDRKRKSPFRPATPIFTQSRPPSEAEMNRNIRTFALLLMNRSSKKDVVSHPADDRDIVLFSQGKHPGPIAVKGMFHLDLRGPYTSLWNKRAAEVFAEEFIKIPEYRCTVKDIDKVAGKFGRHIRTLSGHLDRQEGTYEPSKPEENAADTRLRQLAMQRGLACLSFDGLEDQQDLLFNVFGADSMSEDEPDGLGSSGEKRYRIVEQSWRSADVTFFFRVLDGLYISTRFNEAGRPTPGNWPRIRLPPRPNAPKSNRFPPSGLPRNFFNPKYLAGLYPYQVAKLRIQPPRKLTFPPELIELSNRYRDILSSKMRPLAPPALPTAAPGPPKAAGDKDLGKASAVESSSSPITRSETSATEVSKSPSPGSSRVPTTNNNFKKLSRQDKVSFVEESLKRRRTFNDDFEDSEYFDIYGDLDDEDMG